jgi:hypothetical protein
MPGKCPRRSLHKCWPPLQHNFPTRRLCSCLGRKHRSWVDTYRPHSSRSPSNQDSIDTGRHCSRSMTLGQLGVGRCLAGSYSRLMPRWLARSSPLRRVCRSLSPRRRHTGLPRKKGNPWRRRSRSVLCKARPRSFRNSWNQQTRRTVPLRIRCSLLLAKPPNLPSTIPQGSSCNYSNQ